MAPLQNPAASWRSHAQTVILRDLSSVVKRMLEVIETIDTQVEQTYSLEVIPIKYGKVTDIYETMNSLISGSGGGGGTGGAGIGGARTAAAGGRTTTGGRGTGGQDEWEQVPMAQGRREELTRRPGSPIRQDRPVGQRQWKRAGFADRLQQIVNRASRGPVRCKSSGTRASCRTNDRIR